MKFLCLLLVVLSFSTKSEAARSSCAQRFSRAPRADSLPKHFNTRVEWSNSRLWRRSARHSNNFFIKSGWDETSGSFASEISSDGKQLSDARYIIASSRMIYGLAHAIDTNPSYQREATRAAEFVTQKMTKRDDKGPYFLVAVDSKGNPNVTNAKGETLKEQESLIVNEQAYGLNGLVALYLKTKDPALLTQIESYYKSFYERFHDSVSGGFFDEYSLTKQMPGRTKSYNSTVYVATAFLLELAKLDTPNRRHYEQTIAELAHVVSAHFVDSKTGWIVENFDQDWLPNWRGWQKRPPEEGGYTIGVTGHNFQAAWFLMNAAELPKLATVARQKYLNASRAILTSVLKSRTIDRERGGVFDVFKREVDENMWHDNKAWWQQAEAILALTKADTIGLFTDPAQRIDARRVRDQVLQFYFDHFVDYKNGGEFPVVQKEGAPVLTENKGQLGTGSYHQVELARFMKQYARKVTDRPVEGRQTVQKFFTNYGLLGNWSSFQAEQSKLFLPTLTTVASDHRGTQTYHGSKGYFDSLGDWSKAFATDPIRTGPDRFWVEVVEFSSTRVVVRLHGKLLLKEAIQGLTEIPDSRHKWTEIFSLAKDGSIEKLEVLMNLFK